MGLIVEILEGFLFLIGAVAITFGLYSLAAKLGHYDPAFTVFEVIKNLSKGFKI